MKISDFLFLIFLFSSLSVAKAVENLSTVETSLDKLNGAENLEENYFSLENPLLPQKVEPLLIQDGKTSGASNGLEIVQSPINTTENGSTGQVLNFVVKNVGKEAQDINVNVTDEKGFIQNEPSIPFHLSSGSSQEIKVHMIYPSNETHLNSLDVITIDAKGKEGKTVKRSAYYYYPGSDYEYSSQYQPFCYDRYITGNCRYRTDPYNCELFKWTAYATIQSSGGIQQLRSIPEGLYIPPEFQPGTRDRIRVYLSVSCCIPLVQFISVNPYHPNVGNACIVDVRELQGLHPGEIAGIVIAAALLIIIVVTIVSLLVKKKRRSTIIVGEPTRTRESTSRERD